MIQICQDLKKCDFFWKQLNAGQPHIFNMWEARMHFHNNYQNTPYFVISTDKHGKINGLLPLSKDEKTKKLSFFPGETWHSKTWLEDNLIFAASNEILQEMFNALPLTAHIRYLNGTSFPDGYDNLQPDEIKYFFYPPKYNYSFDSYLQEFPGKSLKKIKKEIQKLYDMGVSFRYNELNDIKTLINMNLNAYKEHSYFYDARFLRSFEELLSWMNTEKKLNVITVMIDGQIAAIDVAILHNNIYVLLAGGTSPEFPGIAKLINFHHMQTACEQKYAAVDFLCGDFGWKRRFRLDEHPLYELTVDNSTTRMLATSLRVRYNYAR